MCTNKMHERLKSLENGLNTLNWKLNFLIVVFPLMLGMISVGVMVK